MLAESSVRPGEMPTTRNLGASSCACKGEMADLNQMTLRAYITGDQIAKVKLNQSVKILVDSGDGKTRELPGTVYWISSDAEFTPKTIQTKNERANLVYATKIRVKNDGFLKIGMYGEVRF